MSKKYKLFFTLCFIAGITSYWFNIRYDFAEFLIVKSYTFDSFLTPIKRIESLDKIRDKLNVFYQDLSIIKNDIKNKSTNINSTKEKLIDINIIDRHLYNYKRVLKDSEITHSNNHLNFLVTPIKSTRRIKKNSEDLPKPSGKFQIIAGRGEWESAQIAITSIEKNIDSITVELINYPENIEKPNVYFGEYIFCKSSVQKKNPEEYQDLLIPLKNINSLYIPHYYPTKINKYETKPIWFSYYFPLNINDGKINFKLKINSYSNKSESGSIVLPFELIISKFKYDQRKKLNTVFGYNYNWTHWYFRDSSLIEENLNQHFNTLANHGIIYNGHLYPEVNEIPEIYKWNKFKKLGQKIFILSRIYKEKFLKDTTYQKNFIKNIIEKEYFLKSENILGNSYLCVFDELQENKKTILETTCRVLKESGVKSKLLSTCQFKPKKELIDFWCPNLNYYLDSSYKHIHCFENTEKWAYACNTTKEEVGNFFIDIPLINSRKIIWNLYKKGISHFLYYAVNNWTQNFDEYRTRDNYGPSKENDKQKKFIFNSNTINWNSYTHKNHNGDGQLVYPLPDGKIAPSVRLINLRDGLDDYILFSSNYLFSQLNEEEILNFRKLYLINYNN